MAAISGRLMSRIKMTAAVSAPVNRTSPSAHQDDSPQGASRSSGKPGGAVPSSMTGPLPVPSASGVPVLRPNHRTDGTHFAGDGRAPARPRLDSTDTQDGGRGGVPSPQGSAGAAHGGIRPSGSSESWANPGGIRMGYEYTPITVLRTIATRLHFTRPRLRPIRSTQTVRETGSPYPGPLSGTDRPGTSVYDPSRPARRNGPQAPRPVPVLRTGHGLTADAVPSVPDPGVVGGGWAL